MNTDTQVSQDSHSAEIVDKNSENDVSTAENQSPVQSEHKHQISLQQPPAGGDSVLETQTAIQLEEIESLMDENQSLMDDKEEFRLRVLRRDRSLEKLQEQIDQLKNQVADYQNCRHQLPEYGRTDSYAEAEASNTTHNKRLKRFCNTIPPVLTAGGDSQQTSSSVGGIATTAKTLDQ